MFSFYTIIVFLLWIFIIILYIRNFGQKTNKIQKYFNIKEKRVSLHRKNWIMRILGWTTPKTIEKNMQKQNFIWKYEEIKKI